MSKSLSKLDSWLDISHDFRAVDSIFIPVNESDGKYLTIQNPRPAVKNQDPSYLNSSLGDLPEIVKGPNGLLFQESVKLEAVAKSIEAVDKIINANNIVNQKATMHTYLLAAAIEICLKKKGNSAEINFLEIGTYDGVNSLIMSLISEQVIVHTFDPVPSESATSWKYQVSKDQEYEAWGSEHFKKRNSNILRPNIKYYPISSSSLLNHIDTVKTPDVVWIDGDHRFPQIAIDLSAVLAMYRDSIILIDDVYLARSNNATVETIRFLARDLQLDVFLHQKKHGFGKFVAVIGNNLPLELVSQKQKPIMIKYSK